MMDELLSLSATELVRRIRSGDVSPLQAVDAHIARIEAVNPALNALVTPMFEHARRQAQLAGERLAQYPDDLPPLLGLPVTVKDAFPVAGFRFTAGASVYRERIASEDAEAVTRLKNAGAIILGKTNCPDLSSSVETNNPVFGLTRNPWNLAHSAGGSSGGEGALIAAGGSPMGLGSDIAGSIRIPAAFCGVCGLKPTSGRIPTAGHVPQPAPALAGWNTVGPLARRIEDLALALSVLSATPVQDYLSIPLQGRRLIVPAFYPYVPVHRDIAAALRQASQALADAGMALLQGVRFPYARLAFEMTGLLHREWFPGILAELGGGRPIKILPEMIANWRGNGRVSSNTLAMMFIFGAYGPPARLAGFGRPHKIAEFRARILEVMGEGGVIIWPVYPTPALRHGYSWGPYGLPYYTPGFNVLGFPSVALPVGWSKRGLPLAVQVVGRPGEDEVALAVATHLEQVFGGWRIAPA